jgi:hypothetical protein
MQITLFAGEQGRGVFGYLGASIISNYLNILLSKYTKLSVTQSTFLTVYVIGNIIIYSSDILFAKEKFHIENYKGILNYNGIVPYSDLKTRGLWLLQSFYKKYFFRFLVTVVIDTIIGLTLLRYTLKKLDELNILVKWKYRNFIVVAIVSAFTYFLYLSTLRFKWAYQYEESPIMNILVMIWVSLALLITASTNPSINHEPTPKWRNMY